MIRERVGQKILILRRAVRGLLRWIWKQMIPFEPKHREQLAQQGWTSLRDVVTEDEMLSIARYLGNPTLPPNGPLVKALVPTSAESARPQTLSAHYGTGPQPLHTDTAFWESWSSRSYGTVG